MAQEPPEFVTKSAAARLLGIGRRTVQRYCKAHPGAHPQLTEDGKVERRELTQNGKVDCRALESIIAGAKFWDGRGWPLGKKRPQRRLALKGGDKKGKAVSHRSLEQRLAIIKREIDAMTDEEQAQFFALGGAAIVSMIRPAAFQLHFNGHDEMVCGYCGQKNRLPRKRPPGTPKWGRCRMLLSS